MKDNELIFVACQVLNKIQKISLSTLALAKPPEVGIIIYVLEVGKENSESHPCPWLLDFRDSPTKAKKNPTELMTHKLLKP